MTCPCNEACSSPSRRLNDPEPTAMSSRLLYVIAP
jgi:hypothetical protein